MRKTLLFTLLALLGMTQAVAQEYEYVPFVREGVQWVCSEWVGGSVRYEYFTLELKGDAEINGKFYKAMHLYRREGSNLETDDILVYLREEDRVVYGIVPDGQINPDYPIGMDTDTEMMEQIVAGEEFVLYDFNEPVKFLEHWTAVPFLVNTVFPDVIDVAGRPSNRYISSCNGAFCAIEGIGYDGLWSWYPLGYSHHSNLSHVIENGEVIYRSEFYKNKREDELMPLVREGVQWVNEKVIINKGDTTRHYYNYEFKGLNTRDYPICYSYTGDVLDADQATVAAFFQTSYDVAAYNITIYNDIAFYQTCQDGRNLINYAYNQPTYSFAQSESDIETSNPVNFYLLRQNEAFLNRQNFVEVEPVEIEGYQCRRYAYLGEDGEPLAYYVEGIGFDSRDMGDLLTPFTRKPDPDADYQEYWGLSHVIKDGKIIYKGMRYRGEAEESVVGDVNSDGRVDINDVAILIDMLLNTGGRYTMPYDVDNNGNVGVSDVTTLIDLLLMQEQ